MTVIASTIWGGKISLAADRRISGVSGKKQFIVDDESNKLIVVLCRDALFAVAYTGVAAANQRWLDCAIADCLAHRQLEFGFVLPGSPFLARPAYWLVHELQYNLNGFLAANDYSKVQDLELLVQGWRFGKKKLCPFSWKMRRGPTLPNGMRYFETQHECVSKFFREHPTGLWGDSIGDTGDLVDRKLRALATTVSFTHDDVERYIRDTITARSKETFTVGPGSVALQLDPRAGMESVVFTHYPSCAAKDGYPLLSPWVMTPTLICPPSVASSGHSTISTCGRYVLGGFSDVRSNLQVVTRLQIEDKEQFRSKIRVDVLKRPKIPVLTGKNRPTVDIAFLPSYLLPKQRKDKENDRRE